MNINNIYIYNKQYIYKQGQTMLTTSITYLPKTISKLTIKKIFGEDLDEIKIRKKGWIVKTSAKWKTSIAKLKKFNSDLLHIDIEYNNEYIHWVKIKNSKVKTKLLIH